jgi:hypothetical protein
MDTTESPLMRREYPRATMTIGRERAAIDAMAALRAIGADPVTTHRLPNGLGYIAPDTRVKHGPITREADYERQAYELGAEHARNAATWVADGNTTQEHIRRVLVAMLEDGDPAAWDVLPQAPDLSGQWADDPTPRSIAYDIVGEDVEQLPEGGEIADALADAYERGVSETFEDACVTELRRWLND